MTASAVVFWVLTLIVLASAAVVVLSRSLINSAFALLATFSGVAGFYVLLGADFLAAVQFLVYVGGILILLVFGVMLTHRIQDLDLRAEARQLVPGLFVAAGVFILLAAVATRTPWAIGAGRLPSATTAEIGRAFLGKYLLPFEAASILLLVALIGAALIVRKREDA
ncbi:MAG: NADH-quinone oxidoreductase subunit J [Vicinamibacteria bacterium]|nr:NADH-quinone oxidoreductase subunit J [Vicinamibacteria bacterium]